MADAVTGCTRAITSLVPTWRRTRWRVSSGAGASARSSHVASSMYVGWRRPGSESTSPRSIAARSMPWRFTAARWPATAAETGWPWVWMPRTFAWSPWGYTSTRSSRASSPAATVPVTTVPNPRIVKTRSIGSRKVASVPRAGTARASVASDSRSAGRPSPVFAETGRIGAPPRNVPRRKLRTSSRTSSSQSGSARSALVSTTTPLRTRRSWQIARCSRVCGITPSSAAMISMTRSMPPTPASMFFTNRSCPGTSTMPRVRPSPRSRWAKPMSMVIPRSFSSLRRSGSIPVSARTRLDLPWSMWPAVPATT